MKSKDTLKISVIGHGVVGKAIVDLLKDHYKIIAKSRKYVTFYIPHDNSYPITLHKIDTENFEETTWEKINNTQLAIISVPTPMAKDKSCDTSIVEEVVSKLKVPLILIKSTIEPGTTEKLKKKYKKRICFSPEFVGESKYYTPPEYLDPTSMAQHPFMIIGGEEKDRQEIIDIFSPVLGPTKKYYQCTAKEAELIKYFENSFFATKITFANEMKDICVAFNVDYYKVREGWLLDNRICPMHSLAIKNKKGYSGRCLPKDTNALLQACKKAGYNAKLLKQVIKSNNEFLKLNK